jgi:hypothetical protein
MFARVLPGVISLRHRVSSLVRADRRCFDLQVHDSLYAPHSYTEEWTEGVKCKDNEQREQGTNLL